MIRPSSWIILREDEVLPLCPLVVVVCFELIEAFSLSPTTVSMYDERVDVERLEEAEAREEEPAGEAGTDRGRGFSDS
jgi:hypothetical protein